MQPMHQNKSANTEQQGSRETDTNTHTHTKGQKNLGKVEQTKQDTTSEGGKTERLEDPAPKPG